MAQEPDSETLTLKSRVFENTRDLRILLPVGYRQSEKRYAVLYFTDGIGAWKGWGVPEIASDLWRLGEIEPLIIVGIDNGGSTLESKDPARDRASEYWPYPDPTWEVNPPQAKGQLFPSFLFDEVMPLINETYRTHPARVGLAGSSYGGAVSLYTAMQFPSRIEFLLLESPSLQLGDGQLLKDAETQDNWPKSIYLGVGTAEGETKESQEFMLHSVRQLHHVLQASSQDLHLKLVVSPNATHWYDAWRERLPGALRFLVSNP